MRFRKTIKLGNIFKLNLSKTGASVSASIPGVKGITFNTGSQGTYVTGSITGTGLSERVKVSDKGVGLKWKDIIGRFTGKKDKDAEKDEQVEATDEQKAAAAAQQQAELEAAQAEVQRQADEINDAILPFTSINKLGVAVMPARAERASEAESEAAIEAWLTEAAQVLEIPVEFEVSYMAARDASTVFVDLDLPEIEDLPDEVATQTATGKLKVTGMKQADLRGNYAKTVFGLVAFLATHIFEVSPATTMVVMSCYTQRRDSAGELADTYILSTQIPREGLVGVDVTTADCQRLIERFEGRVKMTSTNLFQKITPYEPADFGIAETYDDVAPEAAAAEVAPMAEMPVATPAAPAVAPAADTTTATPEPASNDDDDELDGLNLGEDAYVTPAVVPDEPEDDELSGYNLGE